MSFYEEQVLPRFQDKIMGRKPTREVRSRVCTGLRGNVVEIGFGTGLNASYYPAEVKKVMAIEPSTVCMRLAEPRIARSSVVVELAGLNGERLDLPSEEFDVVLSTWTMCTIPNLPVALQEMRRVLKPGGTVHFVEHGHAPDQKVEQWQRRLEPLNKRLGGGCHLTRRIPDEIEQAGFVIDQLETYYLKGDPRAFGLLGVTAHSLLDGGWCFPEVETKSLRLRLEPEGRVQTVRTVSCVSFVREQLNLVAAARLGI